MKDSSSEENEKEMERITKAFKEVDRRDFLPVDREDLAELNMPLPIGYGQTISQPLVVEFMLEKLDPHPGHKILDIGSGSGWTTALLSHIVGQQGKVIGMEIIPELKRFGEQNVAEYNFIEKGIAEFVCEDGIEGFKPQVPYDRILVSAAAEELPSAWKEQVKPKGKIVTPIGHSIFVLTKKEEGFVKEEHTGFAFVPLVSENDD